MVTAIINISEHTNRILNIIKAKYGLNDKSEAINVLAEEYEKEIIELELKSEYIEKMEKRQKTEVNLFVREAWNKVRKNYFK